MKIAIALLLTICSPIASAAFITLGYERAGIYETETGLSSQLDFEISFDSGTETITSLSFESADFGLSGVMNISETPYDLQLIPYPDLFERYWQMWFSAPVSLTINGITSDAALVAQGYAFSGLAGSIWYEQFGNDDVDTFYLLTDGQTVVGEDWAYLVGLTPIPDNISVVGVSEPSTLAPLGLALLGIGLKRRIS